MKITQQGVGSATHTFAIRDSNGTGLLPVQAEVTGSATFRILGRVSPEAPWTELKAAGSTAFLESMAFVPYLQLEVTSGAGTVTLWIAEK